MTDIQIIPQIIDRYEHLLYPSNPVWLQCYMQQSFKYCRCLDKVELNIAALIVAKKFYNKTSVEIKLIENDSYFIKVYDPKFEKLLDGYKNCCEIEEVELLNIPRSYQKSYDPLAERTSILMSRYSAIIMYAAFCLFKCNRDLSIKRNSIISYYFCIDANAFAEYIRVLKEYVCNSNIEHKEYWSLHFNLIDTVLKIYAGSEDISSIMPDVFDIFDEELFQINYDCLDCSQQFKDNLRRFDIEDELNFFQLSLSKGPGKDPIMTNLAHIKEHINKNSPNRRFDKVFLSIYSSIKLIAEKQRRHKEKSIIKQLNTLNGLIRKV